jgi:hypothetical protein
LQTVNAATGTGAREIYPDTTSAIIPFMRMAYSNTGGDISATGYNLGIFLVKAHYTVRGRRAEPLPTLTKLLMLDPEAFKELK